MWPRGRRNPEETSPAEGSGNPGSERHEGGKGSQAGEHGKRRKYDKPKVMVIDLPQEFADALGAAGYGVAAGTFGPSYSVQRSDNLHPLPLEDWELPGYAEQEILIVSTVGDRAGKAPGYDVSDGVKAFWQECQSGVINPRPVIMSRMRDAFDRILDSGGVAIVFVQDRSTAEYLFGARGYRGVDVEDRRRLSNWGFLSSLENLSAATLHPGSEIISVRPSSEIGSLLGKGLRGARYGCSLAAGYDQTARWIPLLENKFGDTVGGLLKVGKSGWLFVLPLMPAASTILVEFLEGIVAPLAPHLFPHLEGSKWVHRPEYELPAVVAKQAEIERLNEEAAQRVADLQGEIAVGACQFCRCVRIRSSDVVF